MFVQELYRRKGDAQFVKGMESAPVLKGKLPTAQNKCSVLKFLFLFLDLGVVIHNPWLQIPPLFFFCG